MNLPQIQNDDQEFQLMQNKWASILNPLIAKPLSSANVLKDVQLINGITIVNHLLGRKMQGWFIADVDASAIVFRSQPMNDKTLTLTSNSDCVVTLMVF